MSVCLSISTWPYIFRCLHMRNRRWTQMPVCRARTHPRFVKAVLQTGFQDCSCLKSYATTKSVRVRNKSINGVDKMKSTWYFFKNLTWMFWIVSNGKSKYIPTWLLLTYLNKNKTSSIGEMRAILKTRPGMTAFRPLRSSWACRNNRNNNRFHH